MRSFPQAFTAVLLVAAALPLFTSRSAAQSPGTCAGKVLIDQLTNTPTRSGSTIILTYSLYVRNISLSDQTPTITFRNFPTGFTLSHPVLRIAIRKGAVTPVQYGAFKAAGGVGIPNISAGTVSVVLNDGAPRANQPAIYVTGCTP